VSDTVSYAINQLSATAFDVANVVGDKTNPSKHLNSPQSSRADHSSTIRQNTFQSSFNSIAFARGSHQCTYAARGTADFASQCR